MNPARFTVQYNGSDDQYHFRGGIDRDGEFRDVFTSVNCERQRQGDFIQPFMALTYEECVNLANALAKAGITATIDNANKDCPRVDKEPESVKGERMYPESTVRAMKAHLKDLQQMVMWLAEGEIK